MITVAEPCSWNSLFRPSLIDGYGIKLFLLTSHSKPQFNWCLFAHCRSQLSTLQEKKKKKKLSSISMKKLLLCRH